MSLLTTEEAVRLLFKVLQGFEETNTGKFYFEEDPLDNRVWTQKSLIPNTAPTLLDGETSGVVKRHVGLTLLPVPGSSNAYYHEYLSNAISFKYGDRISYDWQLTYSNDTPIPKGQFRWLKSPNSRILYFYGGAPASNMPPKISFYEYVGTKDDFAGTGGSTNADEKFRGDHAVNGGNLPSPTSGSGDGGAIKKGDFWRVSVAGTITGLLPEEELSIGDLIYAAVDGAANSGQFFAVSRNISLADYIKNDSTLLPQNQDQADALHNASSPSSGNPLVTLSLLNSAIASLGTLVGGHDASGGLPTTGSGESDAIVKGDYWRVTVAGTITGLTPVEELEVGDIIHASVNDANEAADFFATQANVNWDEKLDSDDPRIPSQNEKDAMTASTNPSATNRFITASELGAGTGVVGTYAGVHDASGGSIPPTNNGSGVGGVILKGDYWRVSVAGTITSLVPFTDVSVGDLIYSTVDNANAVNQFFAVKGSRIREQIESDINVTVTKGIYSPGDTITAGSKIETILNGILAPYQPPTLNSLNVELAPAKSSYEVGETATIGNATIAVTQDSNNENPANMYISGTGFNKAAPSLVTSSDPGSEEQLLTNGSSQWQVTGEDGEGNPISPASFTRSWLFRHFFGASNVVLNGSSTPAEVKAVLDTMQTQALRTGRAASVTCDSNNDTSGYYTYIAYAAKFGDLSSIIQNGALPVLGAFTKIGEISYTNDFGIAEDYSIYISNADKAFASGTSLVII